ncbi:hypothetical protein B9Z55_020176 [Caenorhabditis nigoni]|uniref:Uncharacterized protein n=1 Tax=Caenorhabditis nigoni TaxID=1611254 RepID=A0A2G5TLK5_9PELO|nr:hypothetical protein B9Z55_020176 [Caenorhabditis nigoni]
MDGKKKYNNGGRNGSGADRKMKRTVSIRMNRLATMVKWWTWWIGSGLEDDEDYFDSDGSGGDNNWFVARRSRRMTTTRMFGIGDGRSDASLEWFGLEADENYLDSDGSGCYNDEDGDWTSTGAQSGD